MFLDKIPIRFRLSLGHAALMAVLLLGVGFGIFRLVERNLFQSVDAALLTSARAIRDARFVKGFSSPLLQSFLDNFLGEKFIRPYAQLVDLSGKISAKTNNLRINLPVTPNAVQRAELGYETFETFSRKGMAPLRQITLPVIKTGQFTGELIQVGAPLDATVHTLQGISLVLWLAMPAGLLLSVGFGYMLTRRSLRPVREMSKAAAKLGIDDLGTRLTIPAAKDELRTLAETFNRMLTRLDDAFGRLRRFTGDVSHELRTPIAVLRGEAEFALRKERTPEEYRRSLETIVTEASHMTQIVEDLLLLARTHCRSVILTKEEFTLGRFLEELTASVLPLFHERRVKLTIHNHASEACWGSAGYLTLAIKNILLNASKHSPADSEVVFSIEEDATSTLFIVRDFGEGIPEDALPYIFDPFFRVDTARNRDTGGAGVGLSLALALVQLHGGTLKADSKFGEGATFVVRIPLRRLQDEELVDDLGEDEHRHIIVKPAVLQPG